MGLPLDIPPATGTGSNPGGGYGDPGYAGYIGTPIRQNYYGQGWGGQLPVWLQQNLGQGQYQPQPSYAGQPQVQPSQAPSAGDFYGHLSALFGGGGQPAGNWQQNATSGGYPPPGNLGGYSSPDWAANAASNYPSGRGGYSSGLPQNSGSWLDRLLGNLSPSNLRGQFPQDLGGMTNPEQAAQNSAYWSGINGTGLSNPGFYPGGGVAYNLNTPGGTGFDSVGSRTIDASPFLRNQGGPLSPTNYNWFQYPGGINKPSYQDYVNSFPADVGSMFGGAGSRLPVNNQ